MIEPQQNLEAERAVLGACLIEPQAVRTARQIVTPSHFFDPSGKALFESLCSMLDKGTGVDFVTVADHLASTGKLEQIGGRDFLLRCAQAVATSAHVEYYAKIVARCFYEREIVYAAHRLAKDQDASQMEVLREMTIAKEALGCPAGFNYKTGLSGILDELVTPSVADRLFKTYIPELDSIFDGAKGGEVTTWGAATNTGKSLLLTNLMALSAANGEACLYVSTEMSAKETLRRHLSIASGVEAWRLRKCDLSRDHIRRLNDTISDKLSGLAIDILDDPEPSLRKIEASIARTKAKVVYLDYLERMQLPKAEGLRLQVKEFMREIKNLAMRHSVVIHLASQLNRKTYASQDDVPPTLADLSESSAIEKESDRVFLFWQPKGQQPEELPGVYNPDRIIEVILAKDRHGVRGLKAHLTLNGRTLQIADSK